MKLKLIFTLDYEIHGNGDGSPYNLMIEPTHRLMRLLEKYKARLVILADIGEILKFREYFESTGIDHFFYNSIVEQLQTAIRNGHDVQLHIHSSYFNSSYKNGKWHQDWAEYNMAALPFSRIDEMVKTGKDFLESILKPIDPEYRCNIFRAANWSMVPSENIIKALLKNGFIIDTSVYKWGRQSGLVNYDYSDAYSNLFPYPVSVNDINKKDSNGRLKEYPIYSENRYFLNLITPIRIFRYLRAKKHLHNFPSHLITKPKTRASAFRTITSMLLFLFRKYPWKLDYNQATSHQMITAIKRISRQNSENTDETTVVLIGHSKTFVRYNEYVLNIFFKNISKHENITFGIFPQNN